MIRVFSGPPRRRTFAALAVAGAATLAMAGCKSMGIGDVNGDTHLDVVAVAEGSANLVAMLNDGAGNLSAGPLLGPIPNTFGYPNVKSIAVASLRELPSATAPVKDESSPGQGLDVAALDMGRIGLWVNDGTGAFQSRPWLSAGPNARDMAVGSAGLDPVPDLFVTNATSSGTVSVMEGLDGSVGHFGPRRTYPAGAYPRALALASLSDNSLTDVIVTNDDGVSILRADAKDGYRSRQFVAIPANVLTPGGGASYSNPERLAVADINGDGRLDVLVSDAAEGGRVDLLLGQPNRRFAFAGAIPAPKATTWIAVGDLDGNGSPDVVINGGGTSMTKVIANPTAAAFAAHTPLATAVPAPASAGPGNYQVYALGLGDLDGNGAPDIVLSAAYGRVIVQAGDGTGAFPTDKTFYTP